MLNCCKYIRSASYFPVDSYDYSSARLLTLGLIKRVDLKWLCHKNEIPQVPAAVVDKKSPAYNGGHTQLGCSSLATVDAYAEQSHRDLSSFLTARAVEMVSGGSMLLVFGLRGNYYPYRVGPTLEVQDKIWNDLVLEVPFFIRNTCFSC